MTVTAWPDASDARPANGSIEKHSSMEKHSVWDYVPHVVQVYLIQAEGYAAWKARGASLQNASERRWNELATIAAAAAIRAVRRSHRARRPPTGTDRRAELAIRQLDATDLAVVLFAAEVAVHTNRITEADVNRLRAMGLSDQQVLDIALAAAASCFFADAAAEPAAS